MQKILLTENIKIKCGINDKLISPSALDDMLHNAERSVENSKFLKEVVMELVEIVILAGFNAVVVVKSVDEAFNEFLDLASTINSIYQNIKVQVIIE